MASKQSTAVRKLAKRRGFEVLKSRELISEKNLGGHMLVANGVVLLGENFSAALDQIKEYINRPIPLSERGPIIDPNPDPRPSFARYGLDGFPTFPGFNAHSAEKESFLNVSLGLLSVADRKVVKLEAEFIAMLLAPMSEFGRVPVEIPRRYAAPKATE